MNDYDGFLMERDNGVATITLDVPEKMNRVSYPARAQLAALFDELGDDGAIRVVVLTGAGGNFTAGGDIAGFLDVSSEELSQLAWNIAAAERCPKPVIARIEGYCLGVGLELALACDFRVAAENAQLGLPEIGLGMIPGSAGRRTWSCGGGGSQRQRPTRGDSCPRSCPRQSSTPRFPES